VLPELHKSVQSEGLAAAVEEHLEQTREHGRRLEEVFRALGAEPSSNLDPSVEKLVEHHNEVAGSFANDRLEDVFHAAAAATTEHHELSAYDTLLSLAQAVELPGEVRELLERNRAEEAEALRRFQQERDRLVGELET
jgi:ferritin-like metal-binding protein YciE